MRASFRKLWRNKNGTMYVSIPKHFVKAMELQAKTKLRIDMISKNKLEINKQSSQEGG